MVEEERHAALLSSYGAAGKSRGFLEKELGAIFASDETRVSYCSDSHRIHVSPLARPAEHGSGARVIGEEHRGAVGVSHVISVESRVSEETQLSARRDRDEAGCGQSRR